MIFIQFSISVCPSNSQIYLKLSFSYLSRKTSSYNSAEKFITSLQDILFLTNSNCFIRALLAVVAVVPGRSGDRAASPESPGDSCDRAISPGHPGGHPGGRSLSHHTHPNTSPGAPAVTRPPDTSQQGSGHWNQY